MKNCIPNFWEWERSPLLPIGTIGLSRPSYLPKLDIIDLDLNFPCKYADKYEILRLNIYV